MMKKNNNFVVLGGGSAGWLAALAAKKVFPESLVTLVESEEIGILGAGEGTTPPFVNFLNWLNIPIENVIYETNATIKNGIKFSNWKGDGDYYYHNFHPSDPTLSTHYSNSLGQENFGQYNVFHSLDALENISSKENSFVSFLNEKNKTPFSENGKGVMSYSEFALHFDANKMAKFLKSVAISRGVQRIEGVVSEIQEGEDGNISSLILKTGEEVPLDFVFDASGFSRLIIGKHYKAEWHSYDNLPANSAIPFFLPADKKIPPYTESIAMRYGWIWKIPLQDRYGCGYVYNSNLISEQDAVSEIEEFLGFEPEYPRKNKGGFSFSAGYYKTPWIKNCIAVGLSSGFIEPLEATSLWITVDNLRNAFSNPYALLSQNNEVIKDYNNIFCDFNSNVSDFIYFHYMGSRSDTDFWKNFKNNDSYPDRIKNMITYWSGSVPNYRHHLGFSGFLYPSWYDVAEGLELINRELIKKSASFNNFDKKYSSVYQKIRNRLRETSETCLSHNETISKLKQISEKHV